MVEFSNGEYASDTVMPLKKDIFGNWAEKRMCGDYMPIIRGTKSNRYAMPIAQEIFDIIGYGVFSTSDLEFRYHQI